MSDADRKVVPYTRFVEYRSRRQAKAGPPADGGDDDVRPVPDAPIEERAAANPAPTRTQR